jgi:hypothetical protein
LAFVVAMKTADLRERHELAISRRDDQPIEL